MFLEPNEVAFARFPFLNVGHSRLFPFVYFHFSQAILTQWWVVDLICIRTRIDRVEGERVDHFTTTNTEAQVD